MKSFDYKTAELPDTGTFLIEANAGTGKTYTLEHLYRRLVVEKNLMPSEILVVTFTEAATAELAGRIQQNLAGKDTEEAEENEKEILRKACSAFDEAAIFTIHGFCKRVLQEHAFDCKLPFNAELLTDTDPLIREVVADFCRRKIADGVTMPLKFQQLFSAAKLFFNFPKATLKYHEPLDEEQTILNNIKSVVQALGQLKKKSKFFRAVAALCEADAREFPALLVGLKGDLLTPKTKANAILRDFFEALAVHRLRELHDDIFNAFEERKNRRNLLTFDDLLRKLEAALPSPDVPLAGMIRGQYRAVLIDEFQDTDPVQYNIFSTLFNGRTLLFFIGDPKQAIYGFRGADLNTYLNAAKKLPKKHRFTLTTNYRSVPGLVDAVNKLFNSDDAFLNDDIEYKDSQASGQSKASPLLHNGQPVSDPFRRVLIHKPDDRINVEDFTKIAVSETAVQITALLNDAAYQLAQSGASRRLRPQDFAILTSANKQSEEIKDGLIRVGVPAVIYRASSVFDSREANEFRVFFKALLAPSSRRALKALLASRWCGFDDVALANLESDAQALSRAIDQLKTVCNAWQSSGPATAIELFFKTHNTFARLAKSLSPERSLTNLRHLTELILEHQRTSAASLEAMAYWFNTCCAEPPNGEGHEQRLESDADAVRILTIHKSKGLEFPVVLCPFLAPKGKDKNAKLQLAHDESGHAVFPLDQRTRDEFSSDQMAEHARLMYVALTRAASLCIPIVKGWKFEEKEVAPANDEDAEDAPAIIKPTVYSLLSQIESDDSPTIRMLPLYTPQPKDYKLPSDADPIREPSPPPPAVQNAFDIISYSSLHAQEIAAPRDDEKDDAPLPEPDLILPRGSITGNCLHAILEGFDFPNITSRDKTLAAISKVLDVSPLATRDPALREQRRERVAGILANVFATPLPNARTLSEIPFSDTRREVPFTFPLDKSLNKTRLHAHGLDINRSGFITGFIDLLFRVDGRYYFVDWKSDTLASVDDLHAHMKTRGYLLQLRLYAIALHRILRHMLGDAYAPEKHFGGGFCVFLRHLSPQQPNALFTLAKLDDWQDLLS